MIQSIEFQLSPTETPERIDRESQRIAGELKGDVLQVSKTPTWNPAADRVELITRIVYQVALKPGDRVRYRGADPGDPVGTIAAITDRAVCAIEVDWDAPWRMRGIYEASQLEVIEVAP